MTFVELDESEGFILLGRRREKDFLSTRALLEDQVLASCFSKHLRRARGHGDARPDGRGKATQPAKARRPRYDAASLDALSRGEMVEGPASQDAEPTRSQQAL